MSFSLVLVFIWIVSANVIAMFPSEHNHWPTAYALIAIGTPLLVYVYVQNGLIVTVLVLAAQASILRWPVLFLWRWIKRNMVRE